MNLCNAIVGIDANLLYPFSMGQPMPTGLHTRWEYDNETETFTAHQKICASSKKWFYQNLKELGQTVEMKAMLLLVRQKVACSSIYGVCDHCKTF